MTCIHPNRCIMLHSFWRYVAAEPPVSIIIDNLSALSLSLSLSLCLSLSLSLSSHPQSLSPVTHTPPPQSSTPHAVPGPRFSSGRHSCHCPPPPQTHTIFGSNSCLPLSLSSSHSSLRCRGVHSQQFSASYFLASLISRPKCSYVRFLYILHHFHSHLWSFNLKSIVSVKSHPHSALTLIRLHLNCNFFHIEQCLPVYSL